MNCIFRKHPDNNNNIEDNKDNSNTGKMHKILRVKFNFPSTPCRSRVLMLNARVYTAKRALLVDYTAHYRDYRVCCDPARRSINKFTMGRSQIE